MSEEIRLLEGQFQRVTVGPDDIMIVSFPKALSGYERHRVCDRMESIFQGRRVLILESGIQVGVLSPAKRCQCHGAVVCDYCHFRGAAAMTAGTLGHVQ